jgi:asparagine synthase (glutamine-hydrolysing)
MSGICAHFRFDDRPVDPGSIDGMLEALRDWGDRTAASWVDANRRAALGCRLAPVTPEDAFDVQPLVSADGRRVVVADARIDNRAELTAQLHIPQAESVGLPDSAFILAAYEAWGEDCASRLIGDFAFMIWDGSRSSLFCARDPIGLRVLFYHQTARSLVVASSVPAVLAGAGIEARLNEQKVAELLVLLEDAESTCFAGVLRIPGGHTLLARPEGVRTRRYWRPDPGKELVLRSESEYHEAFHEVFGRAVRDRLRSTKPVAIMLSAGLDSTSVAAVAADALRESGGRLAAFHSAPESGFAPASRPGWVDDESEYVRELAHMHDNIDLHIVRDSKRTPLDDAVRSFEVIGAPVRNSLNLSWVVNLYEQAAARGAGVMLNGGNGNLTISYTGMRSIRDMARAGRFPSALREARALAAVRGHRPGNVIRDQVVQPLIPVWVLEAVRRMRGRTLPPIWQANRSAIRPEFARDMHVAETLKRRRLDGASLDRLRAAEYRLHILASGGDGLDGFHCMRSWYPIETRTPTTDVRVIEFCTALPGSQYLRDGNDRLLVRRGMRGRVPDSILQRRTRGSQAADWSVWFGRMRSGIVEELDRIEHNETARRVLDVNRMKELVVHWPARFGPEHIGDYDLLLLRGIMMGRFIRWFEERWS